MARPKKRAKKRTPRVAIPIAAPIANETAAAAAIAALDQSAAADVSATPTTIPDDAGDGAAEPAPFSFASTSDADSEKRDAPRQSAPAPATSGSKPKHAPKPVSLAGTKFAGLNRDKLMALAAYQENELAQLRTRVEKQLAQPQASKVEIAKLENALAFTWGLVGELAAMKWGEEMLVDEGEQSTLGGVWAPVLADLLENDTATAAKVLPAIIAATSTLGIIAGKARQVKTRRELEAARASGAARSSAP